MIIPSIDLIDGDAVQLVGGKAQALNAGDPRPIADRFGRVGEIAVIDLDAALSRGDNRQVIEDLVSRARCRVGGGIRSVEAARRWLDVGASGVILGTAACVEVLEQLPRERVWAALDCVNGKVVDHGWTNETGADVLDRIVELREYVAGFLVTFVETEGRMTGLDLDRVAELRAAVGDAKLTVAGGIATIEEIAALDVMGVDAQVGMALYTGAIELADAFVAPLVSDRPDGLFPTVVCDEQGRALGLAYSSRESLRTAIDEGVGAYQSRKRGLWRKGESSGARQRLVGIDVDCDRDTLRFRVQQAGEGFCHQKTATCWGASSGLVALDQTLQARTADAPQGSYTRKLLDDPQLLAAKIREEADELIKASSRGDVTWEAADLLYFALTRARAAGVELADIERELDRRARRVSRRSVREIESAQRELIPLREVAEAQRRGCAVDSDIERRAAVIVGDVREHGLAALIRWSEKLGDLQPGESWRRSRGDLEAAIGRIDASTRGVLERTAARISSFAEAQREMFRPMNVEIEGGRAGHRVQPVASAGCYAPGGRYPLPSSVLMTAITARVAGVERVVVASPRPDDVTLAAAAIAGADELLAVGGAQAVAALAYGVEDFPAVDVIVGPGNAWVTAAKKLVFGDVGIDMLAGPSELLVVADEASDAALIASDLIAQAEHDPDAVPILLTTDLDLVGRVRSALADQLSSLPTAETAAAALRNGYSVVAASRDDLVRIANELAPEHLEVQTGDATISAELVNFGALFDGSAAAEVLGDYGAGPNHVLPTGGTARFSSGLSVAHFLRLPTWMRMEQPSVLAEDAVALARIEGLEGHARSALQRQI